MPILESLNRNIKEPKKWKTSKKIGLALIIIATICYSGVLTNLVPFFHTFLLGTFGLFSYVIFFVMYLIGGALFAGKKYVFKPIYIFYLMLFLVNLLGIFHCAFIGNVEVNGFFNYLGFVYNKQITVGGLLLSLYTYPLQLLFGFVGAFIIFSVLICVSVCLIVNYLTKFKNKTKVESIKNQVKSEKQVTYQNYDNKVKQVSAPVDFNYKEKSKEQVNIGLKAEQQKQMTAKEIALQKLGLLDNDNNEEKKQELRRENRLKFNSNDVDFRGTFGYNANSKSYSQTSYTNDYLSSSYMKNNSSYNGASTNSKPINSTDENMKFLKATMGYDYASISSTQKDNSSSKFEGGVYDSKENYLSANFGIKPKKTISNDNNDEYTYNMTDVQNNTTTSYKGNVVETDINNYNSTDNLVNTNKEEHSKVEEIDLDNFVVPDSLKTNHKERTVNFKTQEQEVQKPEKLEQTTLEIDESYNKQPSMNDLLFGVNPIKPITPKKSKETSNLSQTSFEAIEQLPVKEKKKKRKYNRPSIDLLTSVSTDPSLYGGDVEKNSRAIEDVLNSFKIPAKVINIIKGPAVTRYELEMPVGISVNKVVNYTNDIAMAVASEHGVRIEAPIPGKSAVGIEVPNNKVASVALRDVIESPEFQKATGILNFAVGKEINGNMRVCDLQKMPHMLVAGSTGSGKSVCLNTMLISMLYKYSPDDLKLILIDPKQVEFFMFNGLPHMLLKNAITDPQKAINALKWAIQEMERRYSLMTNYGVRNLGEYNKTSEVVSGKVDKVPSIVIVIDEVADLMATCSKELEDYISRLAAKARAAGIHIVLATQRPSVDVITGVIKTNLPSRIAFAVQNYQDSKTILDKGGAEKLLGKGDMLLQTMDMPEPKRVQGCFVSDAEVKNITDYVKQNNDCEFDELIEEEINREESTGSGMTASGDRNDEELDAYFVKALHLVIETGSASVSMLQRRFSIGFARAGKIIDQMTRLKFISPPEGSKPRSVYITMDEFIEKFGDVN